MPKTKNLTVPADDALCERIQQARRSPSFAKIPAMATLIRMLLEQGLDRLEQADAQRLQGASA